MIYNLALILDASFTFSCQVGSIFVKAAMYCVSASLFDMLRKEGCRRVGQNREEQVSAVQIARFLFNRYALCSFLCCVVGLTFPIYSMHPISLLQSDSIYPVVSDYTSPIQFV